MAPESRSQTEGRADAHLHLNTTSACVETLSALGFSHSHPIVCRLRLGCVHSRPASLSSALFAALCFQGETRAKCTIDADQRGIRLKTLLLCPPGRRGKTRRKRTNGSKLPRVNQQMSRRAPLVSRASESGDEREGNRQQCEGKLRPAETLRSQVYRVPWTERTTLKNDLEGVCYFGSLCRYWRAASLFLS